MPDFETFGGVEQPGQIDQGSFEKFKERVKAASAQIKALKKGEQKVREKENKLIKILLKFVKNHQKKDIMLLIARLLEQNIPPVFVLSLVLLGNEDVLKEAEEQHLLKAGEGGSSEKEVANNKALAFIDDKQALPLELKIKIDEWMKNILTQGLEDPKRIIKTAYDDDGNIKLPLIQLSAFILRDFLEENKQEPEYEKLKEFSDFFIGGILKKIKEKAESMKELKEGN